MSEVWQWAPVVAYFACWLVFSRLVYGAIRTDCMKSRAGWDSADAAMFGFLCTVGGFVWPLAVPMAVVMWRPPKTPQELKAKAREQAERIDELERELGIGKYARH